MQSILMWIIIQEIEAVRQHDKQIRTTHKNLENVAKNPELEINLKYLLAFYVWYVGIRRGRRIETQLSKIREKKHDSICNKDLLMYTEKARWESVSEALKTLETHVTNKQTFSRKLCGILFTMIHYADEKSHVWVGKDGIFSSGIVSWKSI